MATTDPKLNKIIEVLKTEYNPIRLFLFGSRSNGTALLDSDYDFVLVVEENNSSRHVSMAKARSASKQAHLIYDKCYKATYGKSDKSKIFKSFKGL